MDDPSVEEIQASPDGLGYEQFPCFYSNSGQFTQNSDGLVIAGATAKASVKLNNYPHQITGFRASNVFAIPAEQQTQDAIAYLKFIASNQDIITKLTQANIVIEPTAQDHVTGEGGIHWHPFEVPYNFRGGNNLAAEAVRTIPYPDYLTTGVTWKTTWVGWMWLRGRTPPPGPPSTGMR